MWCPEPACLKQESTEFSYFELRWRFETEKRFVVRACGAPLGFVQDQLWAGLARSLVWGSASLGSRPDSRSESDSYLGRLGLKLSSARLSSCLGWLGTRLDLAQNSTVG